MTKNEEFQAAIWMITSCKATMNCGCEYDEELADELWYQCANFLNSYKKRIQRDLKSRT